MTFQLIRLDDIIYNAAREVKCVTTEPYNRETHTHTHQEGRCVYLFMPLKGALDRVKVSASDIPPHTLVVGRWCHSKDLLCTHADVVTLAHTSSLTKNRDALLLHTDR